MTIRQAVVSDLPAISAIQTASAGAAQWECADYLNHSCLVADLDGVVGFIVSRQVAQGEQEILNVAVDPRHRRKGIARGLLKAATGGQRTWFLEVRESNQAAIALYTAAGFQAAGRRENYYRDPTEAAIVMRLDS